MNILGKFKETAISVLPVMAIVFLLGLTIVPLAPSLLLRFFISGLLLIAGLTIFLLGVDLGIQPMGERCGAALTKKKSLSLLLLSAFVIDFIIFLSNFTVLFINISFLNTFRFLMIILFYLIFVLLSLFFSKLLFVRLFFTGKYCILFLIGNGNCRCGCHF